MKNTIFLIVTILSLTFWNPLIYAGKKVKRAKSPTYNEKYLIQDLDTKELHFRKEMKKKIDKILKKAFKKTEKEKKSKIEEYKIPESVIKEIEELKEYDYDYSKVFKGDEDDPDFEQLDLNNPKVKKLIKKLEKKRDYKWGWFWDKKNRAKRYKKFGKWEIWQILKWLAWKHYRIALKYHNQHKYKKAVKHLKIALWYWPTFYQAHTQLGIENIALKRYNRAEINFKRAIKINPKYGKAFYGLSLLYVSKDPVNLYESIEACEYAKELNYDVDKDYYSWLMFLIGQKPEEEEENNPQPQPIPKPKPIPEPIPKPIIKPQHDKTIFETGKNPISKKLKK